MNFDLLYIKFFNYVENLKKTWLIASFSFISLCLMLYLYVQHSLVQESSSLYLNYLNKNDDSFLNQKQIGIYESIRKNIKSENNDFCEIENFVKKNPQYEKYMMFLKKLENYFDSDFDSIVESEDSYWRYLYLFTKSIHNKKLNNSKNLPYFIKSFDKDWKN